MRNSEAGASGPWAALIACVLIGSVGGQAWAQLDAGDIAALREQGERDCWTFTVSENSATRYSLEELCGLVEPEGWRENARFNPCTPERSLPDSFDWRDVVPLPPVRNQASCGSCWAFATTGPLECNIHIKDGIVVDLSEQWLVSCNSDGWGCGGGWWAHDYHQWKTDPCGGSGAPFEADFPYAASDLPCNCPYPHEYTIDDWAYVGGQYSIPPVANIKQALMDYGPISVAVYVNSAFHAYSSGVFNSCGSGSCNHGVTLVGWDDNQGPGGVWIIRNSWGPGWGEGGYMRITYGCSSIGYAAAYIDYPGGGPPLAFEYPEGLPVLASPLGTTVRVNVLPGLSVPIADSARLHYALDGEAYTYVQMTHMGSDQYEAQLPATDCYGTYDWYVSANSTTHGRVSDPLDAPAMCRTARVATSCVTMLEDDFETDLGWTVEAGATDGNWERAEPMEAGYLAVISQPGEDHTPTGSLCFVTGPAGGNAGSDDVDGGPSRLTSPAYDLSGVDAIVSYWRWYHISTQLDDELVVEVSNDGGASWVTVETVNRREEWKYVEWLVSDHVDTSAAVRVRFTVDDTPNNSVVESLIDDFRIEIVECSIVYEPGDMNCDGQVGFGDINPFVEALIDPVAYEATHPDCDRDLADMNEDGEVDFGDINAFVDRIVE